MHSNSKQSALILAQTSWRFGTLLLWVPACQIVGRCGLFWWCYFLNNDSTTKIDNKPTEIPQKVHHFWPNQTGQFFYYYYGYQHVKVQPERCSIGIWVNTTKETEMWYDWPSARCTTHISACKFVLDAEWSGELGVCPQHDHETRMQSKVDLVSINI